MTAARCELDRVDVREIPADRLGDVGKAVDDLILRKRAGALVRAMHGAVADTERRRACN